MHSPGVCGVVLALNPAVGGSAAELEARIDALNPASELVLVAISPAGVASLSSVIWSRAAYLLEMADVADDATALRAALNEVLSRGRDTALVTGLGGAALAAETARAMVALYAEASDEVWAVEAATGAGAAVLLGRDMIERLLRSAEWRSAEELLKANRAHVVTLQDVEAGR